MSSPKHVFLDTSVFDATGYNFQTATIRAFVAAARSAEVVLLLPRCTEHEIQRHIKERAEEAYSTLLAASRKAPFLRKWDKWPSIDKNPSILYELTRLGERDLSEFLDEIEVLRLDYSAVSIDSIMDWYERRLPPFGDGKKRKEFPDAIAIATLLGHATHAGEQIGVVSADGDFRKACEAEHDLQYFASLPAMTQALIEGDRRVAAVRAVLESSPEQLLQGIRDRFPELDFVPEADDMGDASDGEPSDVQLSGFDVIGIGQSTATIAFSAEVEFSAYVSYPDPDYWMRDDDDGNLVSLRSISGTVTDSTTVTGTAKLTFNDDWSATSAVADVVFETSSVEVHGEPPVHAEDDWTD